MKTIIVVNPDNILEIDLAKPETWLEDLSLKECMDLLAKVPRHNGVFGSQVNVMAHSKHMSTVAQRFFDGDIQDLEASCLCHDLVKVFIGDITNPVKIIIDRPELKLIEKQLAWQGMEKYFPDRGDLDLRYEQLDLLSIFAEAFVFGGSDVYRRYTETAGVHLAFCDIVKFSRGMADFYEDVNS